MKFITEIFHAPSDPREATHRIRGPKMQRRSFKNNFVNNSFIKSELEEIQTNKIINKRFL